MNKKTLRAVFGLVLFLAMGIPGYPSDIQIDATSPFVYPEFSKRISMDFQDAPLVDVLKIFSQQSRMNLVTSSDIAEKRVTVYLDDVPIEQALDQILRANNLMYELQPGSDIYLVKPVTKPEVELVTRVYPLKHATVSSAKLKKTLSIRTADAGTIESSDSGTSPSAGLLSAIKGILSSYGKVFEDPRTNSLIITDIASNFPRIERTIEQLDVPVPQILIEVEMLEVTKETADLLGLKVGSTPLTFTGAQRSILYPWNQNDIIRNGFVFEDPDEYTVGTIDASGLTATLQFLRTQTDTKNLARPRILTLNNEAAQIKISTDEAIGSQTTSVSTGGSVGETTTAAERVNTGVFLTVTPQANLVTGEITLAIAPKVIIAQTGGTFQGVTFLDPEERGSQSILRVKSGETIVIGGLLRNDSSKIITKVPLLGDLPLIGGAFRHKDHSDTERELVIFITPIILEDVETFSPEPAIHTRPMAREQDFPSERLREIEKELSVAEQQK